MSSQIEINGVELVPLKLAAKQVSYSRDYLSKLARDKKVVATQIGRQWFIDMASLQNFVEVSNIEQSLRKKNLREERKRELTAKQELQVLSEEMISKKNSFRQRSLIVSMLVLFFGFFTGAVVYTGADITNKLNLSIPASSLIAQSTMEVTVLGSKESTAVSTTIMEYPLFMDEEDTRVMNTNPDGIFLLAREGRIESSEDIASLFSDPVAVEFENENTGIVKYKNELGDITEFPFVSVHKGRLADENIKSMSP